MSEINKTIDEAIRMVKLKIDSHGVTYSDSKVILTLEIIRLEIMDKNKVTDYSLRALKEISSTSYHNYKVSFPEIYSSINAIMGKIAGYNPNLHSADLEILGFAHEKWCSYFGGSIRYLLDSLDYYTNEASED